MTTVRSEVVQTATTHLLPEHCVDSKKSWILCFHSLTVRSLSYTEVHERLQIAKQLLLSTNAFIVHPFVVDFRISTAP